MADLEYKICDLCGAKYPVMSKCVCFWKSPTKVNGKGECPKERR